jgi:hypothetical protein
MTDVVPADKFARLPERYQRRAREIAERVSQIDELCRIATPDEIGTELKRLRGQLRPQPETDVRDMAEGFRFACRDLPAWAISEAANDFLDGRVSNHTGQYMPTCAEFAVRARSILLPFLAERSSLRTETEKQVERATDDARRHQVEMQRQDPAVKARVAALVADATAGIPKRQRLTHRGLSEQAQARIDLLKQHREFVSKIGETKIGMGKPIPPTRHNRTA